jgi:uncharacterized SAM-binding protein YcdF (DUF218 family)
MDQRPRRHRRRWLVIVVFVVVLLAVPTARLFVWPPLRPVPPRVDAVVELAGPGDRDSAALTLARAHRTSFVVQSTVVAEAGTHRCLPPSSGVTVLCFHADPPTTRGEARSIAQLVAQYHWASVAVVTTPDQAWRAELRVLRCFPGQVYVTTAPLPPLDWLYLIPYQWVATAKALIFERSC